MLSGIHRFSISFGDGCHCRTMNGLISWVDMDPCGIHRFSISFGDGCHCRTMNGLISWVDMDPCGIHRFSISFGDGCHCRTVVVKVHRSSTWVKVQIHILKYYSSKSKSTAFSILLEWKYKSTQFFMYLSKKVLIDRFILQFYIDYFI